MSGFITHWVYSSRVAGGWQEVKRFYVRRFGRVVVTTWVAMSFGMLVILVQTLPKGTHPDIAHVLRCYAFLEPWLAPADWCPNGQTWTVAALLPSWLLYPFTRRVIAELELRGGTFSLLLFGAFLWGACFVPMVVIFVRQGFTIYEQQGAWTYEWPPSQMPDFVLGCVASAVAQRFASQEMSAKEEEQRQKFRGLLADASVLLVLVSVLVVPCGGQRVRWEPLFNHCFGPLYACFLFGSADGAGVITRLLCHPGLVAFGAYSFEVFLFQNPWHEMWVALGDVTGRWQLRDAHNSNSSSGGFMTFFLSLWLAAGVYMHYVEGPLVERLKALWGGSSDTQPAHSAWAADSTPNASAASWSPFSWGSAATFRRTSIGNAIREGTEKEEALPLTAASPSPSS